MQPVFSGSVTIRTGLHALQSCGHINTTIRLYRSPREQIFYRHYPLRPSPYPIEHDPAALDNTTLPQGHGKRNATYGVTP